MPVWLKIDLAYEFAGGVRYPFILGPAGNEAVTETMKSMRRSRRQLHRLNTGIGQHIEELGGEQRVAVMNEVPLAIQDSVVSVGELPGNLTHPQSVRRTREPCHLNLPRRTLDEE